MQMVYFTLEQWALRDLCPVVLMSQDILDDYFARCPVGEFHLGPSVKPSQAIRLVIHI